ncbi:MAG: dTDP-4-dehydrorhamnose 3,5-epimerase [Bacteroidota bacterium]
MIYHACPLEGAFVIEPEPFEDQRGLFARTFCKKDFRQIGHRKEFVQFNHSVNRRKGTVRGMHYQLPPHSEIKLVRCIQGSVYDVIVDLRRNSPTFLQHFGVELSESNLLMLYIPEGFAHGFQTLKDHTALIYHHTAYYAPKAERGLRYDDPRLDIHWPLPPVALSKKDQLYPKINFQFNGLSSLSC